MATSEEVRNLLDIVQKRLISYIHAAESDSYPENAGPEHSTLTKQVSPQDLQRILNPQFPAEGQSTEGLVNVLDKVLEYSVNTWHQGFLDKLYASTNAPGVAAELILATLNTNLHVYQVSPALTVIEKHTAQALASLFGFHGPYAGGISVQGGSASNTTSIVIARNTLYPETKTDGYGQHRFVLFTSAHGHYSIEKAAQMCGFGSKAVWGIPIDETGRLIPEELERLVQKAKREGYTPFYVNATAGTTVMGSFDPFEEVAAICKKHNLWMHVDGSWGGSFIFSDKQKHKLAGVEKANSIAINPHKMLGVPVTCSFLLGADLRQFHRANTLPAGYLFHNDSTEEVWDLADLTLQCGRRGDSLKLFLSWTYYGTLGYAQKIDHAHEMAAYLASLIDKSSDFILVSENSPPCLQVCFYYAPLKTMVWPVEEESVSNPISREERGRRNSAITETITKALVPLGFMLDFAPPSGNEDAIGNGKFFRCVVNIETQKSTVEALVRAIQDVGATVVPKQRPERQLHGDLEPSGAPHDSVYKKNPFIPRGPIRR
ncbi:hypothetical protein KEM54_006137 [Ascosphaera aggregata]|nr:hypothetical protein KEM54_006137 [Ascosphaera aggregata]